MRLLRRFMLLAAVALAAVAHGATTAAAEGRCGAPAQRAWCDTTLSPQQRTALLLDALTLDEKISLLAGDDAAGVITGNPATGTSNGVDRLGVPTVYHSDGPVGPREREATAMPAPLGLAATFNPGLARLTGEAIADEVRKKGNDLVHAPTVDIMRTPLAGRTFEGYGEDPFLSSRLGVEWIRGAQSKGVIANVKHYAPNSQEGQVGAPPLLAIIGGRFNVDAIVDERTLREIYLPAFEAAVKEARVGSVMCAYNRINGAPACESRQLLEEILRDDWGFKGFVLSDYGFAAKSTAGSLNNGMDLEMPIAGWYSRTLVSAALASGQVTPATIDLRVGKILETMFRFGVFDRQAFRSDDSRIDKEAHGRVAQVVEENAITLLRNRGVLPLDATRLDSLAIIGSEAATYKGGGGSSAVRPFTFESPRDAITRRAGPGVQVTYDPAASAADAAAAARGADVAIVFASDIATEGVDKPCLALRCAAPDPAGGAPGGSAGRPDPDEIIQAVANANSNTVVVLETAGPVLTPWVGDVDAVVEAWYPGQQGGPALARMLFGDVDPGGRLPVTFPVGEGDYPTAGNPQQYPGVADRTEFSEGVFVGYRHYDERGIKPRFPFGHGLSYTSFEYSDFVVGYDRPRVDRATAFVTVHNTGSRPGWEVVQLYVGFPAGGPAAQPPRALKGFRKVFLAPGESRRVHITLGPRTFGRWDPDADRFVTDPGCYRIEVGRSSRDIRRAGLLGVGGARC